MIVKKVGNPKKTATKAARCGRLVDYILNPDNENSNEKCIYSGARGFLTDNQQSQKAEMIALSQEAIRSKDTINHYVLSWQEDEQPSHEQIEEAVSIFMDELGLKDHQVIYGLHADTDNLHLHIAVNRVHLDSLKVIKPNKGFDKEAAHKAIARIEHIQGWKREQNGRYQVLDNGEIGREHIDPKKPKQPPQHVIDMEHRTGEKSATRIAIEEGTAIFKVVKSWQELHQNLAKVGMRYERTGSGATVFVGDIGVKASDVYRSASLPQLQKKLGPYEPYQQAENEIDSLRHGQIVGTQRKPEPLIKDVPGWDTYIAGRKTHYAEKEAATTAQRQKHDEEHKQLAEQHKAQRAAILAGSWQGRGALLNAMRSVLSAEQAADKASLKDSQRKEREQLRDIYRPYPDLEQWLREQKHSELADAWRYKVSEPQHIVGGYYDNDDIKPRDIRHYVGKIHGGHVHYTLIGKEETAFIDKGGIIDIHDWQNRDSVLAALQLSQQKWRTFQVTGNDQYKALCVKLAAEHGFQISNPELQQSLKQERQRLKQEQAGAVKSEPLKQFQAYHEAVNAERYRVTSVKRREDGSEQTFIIGKKVGSTQGFTAAEIEQRTPDMQRLQRQGESIHYTPLSAAKHHILIDAMDQKKLDSFIQEGYKPAVVLELSPGYYQALITVPKSGTPYDTEVGNRLAQRLNEAYGNPNLSGCVNPHSAPGYQNRQAKHPREDGSYPEVKLLEAARRECIMTLTLSSQMDADYQTHYEQKGRPQQEGEPRAGVEVAATSSAISAYQQHYNDVLKRQSGVEVNLNRVDSMIAVRMRVTGHRQAEIESAIRQCAPAIRTPEQAEKPYNWDSYAQRTARYAFGAKVDRDVANLEKYRQQWETLEGRTIKIESVMADNDRNMGFSR